MLRDRVRVRARARAGSKLGVRAHSKGVRSSVLVESWFGLRLQLGT